VKDLAKLKERLRFDTPFYAENCLKIVNKQRQLVPFKANPAQLKFDAALEVQRLQGKPMRAIVLKARQLGFSTWTQGKVMQRISQRPHHDALVVAHDMKTAGKLFGIGEMMHANLPPSLDLGLKPRIANQRRQNYLLFGEPSRLIRSEGIFGLNSSLLVDTANELETGRGQVYSDLHCSELGFWLDIQRKLTSLLSAVPNEPETLVVLESTANGYNYFKSLWDDAVAGTSDYIAVFAGWHEDLAYVRPFANRIERREFIETIGEGEIAEAEPQLQEEFGATPEQLHWRRHMILSPLFGGSVQAFQVEYPASPEEAFLGTVRQVFPSLTVGRIIRATEDDAPAQGDFESTGHMTKKTRGGPIQVTTGAKWRDRPKGEVKPAWWNVWEHSHRGNEERPFAGQYVIGVDVAGGEEDDYGKTAWHAIVVIDHKTRRQVAEHHSRTDPDLLAEEILRAALYYNRATVAVETTGGWGAPVARRLWRDFGYTRMYLRKSLESRKEHQEERLGWDTNRVSKQFLEDTARELLREGTHGVRSHMLALEMRHYVRDARGRTGPEPGKFSDLLMAWMVAQQVAHEVRPRPERLPGLVVNTTTKRQISRVGGY